MTWAYVAVAAAAAISAYTSYDAKKSAQSQANYNAQVADIEAKDAIRAGDEEASKVRRQNAQLAGAQRAGFSARGLDITEGSTADALDQTDFFSQVDQATAKQNAAKQAWALRARKQGYQYEAAVQRPGFSSLLAAGSTVASKWSSYKGQ
jgi:hypothetical protein